MVSTIYANAMTEVLQYLKGIREEDLAKIPSEFISFLENNSSQEYSCDIDYTQPLKNLNLLNETKGIICFIAYNYWCETDSQKEDFYNKLSENEKVFQKALSQKFDSEDIFQASSIEKTNNTTSTNLIEIDETENETFYQKIVRFIKDLFYRRRW